MKFAHAVDSVVSLLKQVLYTSEHFDTEALSMVFLVYSEEPQSPEPLSTVVVDVHVEHVPLALVEVLLSSACRHDPIRRKGLRPIRDEMRNTRHVKCQQALWQLECSGCYCAGKRTFQQVAPSTNRLECELGLVSHKLLHLAGGTGKLAVSESNGAQRGCENDLLACWQTGNTRHDESKPSAVVLVIDLQATQPCAAMYAHI